ncbi:MAG: glycosyltransferase family 4 protein [Anaerolineae bacterium]|nr:glycosyltransferase family 4 protein [Anaerolineae bacterium]
MARYLVNRGHQVTMIAEIPNHPTGVVPAEYRGKLYERVNLDGIDVIRVWVQTSPRKTFYTRMALYLSFMIAAILAGLLMARRRYDVIYASSPPLFVGGAAWVLSYLRRTPLVFEVRDLWPESAIILGELTNKPAIALSELLEKMCYQRARYIVTVVNSIKKRLLERGYPEDKIYLIPNGANTELYTPAPINQELRKALGISPDQFVLIFTGLHGLMHGVDTAVETAHLLRTQEDILFLFVGDGVRKAAMQARTRELGLPNMLFLPLQPEKELPGFINMANVGLSLGRKNPLSRGALPVKMFSYMACARPVILADEGEPADLVQRAGAGLVVEPENPQQLAETVLTLYNNPDLCAVYGQNGRNFVELHYSRQQLAEELEQLLKEVVNGSK